MRFTLQMADAMEMMILAILSPALHCDWWLPSWKQAFITTVRIFVIVCLFNNHLNVCCVDCIQWNDVELDNVGQYL